MDSFGGHENVCHHCHKIKRNNCCCRKCPTGATGPTDPIGPTGSTGPTGSGMILSADFFALIPTDNRTPINPSQAIEFPQDGPNTSAGVITRFPDLPPIPFLFFVLRDIGVYQILFQVSVNEPGQLVVVKDLDPVGIEISNTVVGNNFGNSQIVGICLITTEVIDTVISIRNPAGNAPFSLTPNAGGAQPVSAHLNITKFG